jgi:hypothetical protein
LFLLFLFYAGANFAMKNNPIPFSDPLFRQDAITQTTWVMVLGFLLLISLLIKPIFQVMAMQ